MVRAVNTLGPGAPSAALLVSTLRQTVPSKPRFLRTRPTGETSIDLEWLNPLDNDGSAITRYEVCVINEDGSIAPFEPTDGAQLKWRIRGLAFGHIYGFRVRAINILGVGPPSDLVQDEPTRFAVRVVPPGRRIPLLDVDRQTLIVRLQNIECLIRVWWQPFDQSWYGSLEAPVNSIVVEGRRLASDAGLLDRISSPLSGNIVCRAMGATNIEVEPARNAWEVPTHGLFWEVT